MIHRRAKLVYERALDHETAERLAFVDTECGSDLELRAEVEALLGARSAMGEFLGRSARESLQIGMDEELDSGTLIGSYRVVRLLGRGGSGCVYEAIQARPKRRVALKLLHGNRTAEPEILAQLRHPGIAHVYEAGIYKQRTYFALEYVEGAQTIVASADAARLDVRGRLALVARVCDAVHHGHQRGIIHRDIKPGNVLVDPTGRPKVIDFGIAHSDAQQGLEPAGTLPYMSPEQCGGGPVDVRTDVYSLGVLAYRLLNGRLPLDLDGLTVRESLLRIRSTPPAAMKRSLRGDPSAIVRKALAKDPAERYASAAALGDDIRRHLEHRTIDARPAGFLEQVRKFGRRQPLAFAALVAVVVVSILAAAVSGRFALENHRARRAAELQAYVANMAAGYSALRVHDVGEARLRLELAPAHHRNWEWRHLRARLDTSRATLVSTAQPIRAGAVSPDGRLLLTAASGLRVRDVVAGKTLWETGRDGPVAYCPTRDEIAVATRRITVRDARTGEIEREWSGHAERTRSIAYDAAGERLVTASYDGTVKVWSVADGALLRTLRGPARFHVARFSSDGTRIAAGGLDKIIRVWDASGDSVTLLAGHEDFIEDLAFSPDDTRLVSVAMEGPVYVWDVATGNRVARATGHTRYLKAVAFAPDGRTFATAGADRTVRIWETDGCREIACHIGHTAVIYDLATHPDGVVSFSFDGTARLWGTTEHEPVKTVATDIGPIARLAFNPNGDLLALASRDGSRLEVRETRSLDRVVDRRFASPHAGSIRFDASDSAVLERTAKQAGARTPSQIGGDKVTRTAVTRARVAALTARGALYLLDAGSLAVIARLKGHSDKVSSMAFSPDGSRLVSGGHDGSVRLWDADTGLQVAVLHGHSDRVFSVAFSRNGERIASGTQQGEVRIWTAPAESAR